METNNSLIAAFIVLISLSAIISGCSGGLEAPRIELSETFFDLGDIDPSEGTRTETFLIKNSGNAPLNIISVSTSCSCTEAEVEKEEIAPGEQTKLTVTYDPSVHPGLTGKIKRIVYIKSNDPLQEEIELEIVGNSLPLSDSHEEPDEHDEEYEGLLKDGASTQEDLQRVSQYDTAVIYYNDACSMCAMYIKQELIPALERGGIKNIIKKDYVNEKQNRVELNELNRKYNIPPDLQGHFMTFIDNRIILGGHVPEHIIIDLLTKDFEFDRILVLQDEMDKAESYFAWGFKGDAKKYDIDEPISTYIGWFSENKDSLKSPDITYESSWSFSRMLPLIISTGFLDGINPCAFAVLLFFIAFLYTIHKTKASIWKMGIAYVFAIFLAYFLIGIGLMKAFIFTGYPHLFARIGAYLLIGLGVINISGFILPNHKIKLGIPSFSKKYLKQWMYQATIPAALVTGFLVGLCTFPCSGGMYVAIIGLLAAKATYMQGFAYLIIYNIMFIMPLIIILIASSSKKMADKIDQWEHSQSKVIKLVLGIVMILLGLAILFWFI